MTLSENLTRDDLRRALLAGTAFFLALFALGFALGTIRVLFVAPRIGPLGAVSLEVPIMLVAGFAICRWSVRRWQVSRAMTVRWAMTGWFLALLFLFETMLGATLFGRTLAEQWAALATPEGLLGISAQIVAALLPLFIGRNEHHSGTLGDTARFRE